MLQSVTEWHATASSMFGGSELPYSVKPYGHQSAQHNGTSTGISSGWPVHTVIAYPFTFTLIDSLDADFNLEAN